MKRKLELLSSFLLLPFSIGAQIGPPYDLSHNVIAGGGGSGSQSSGGQFTLDGTTGQPLAGTQSNGGSFRLRGGFWAEGSLAPTAAPVTISGRIISAGPVHTSRVRIILQDLSTGAMRSARPNNFGYYRFEDITIGLYLIRAESRNYQFAPGETLLNLNDSLAEFDFTALPAQ